MNHDDGCDFGVCMNRRIWKWPNDVLHDDKQCELMQHMGLKMSKSLTLQWDPDFKFSPKQKWSLLECSNKIIKVDEWNGVCMLGSFNSTASGHLGTANNHVKWWEESGKYSQKVLKFAFRKLRTCELMLLRAVWSGWYWETI